MSVAVLKMYYNHIDRLWVEDPDAGRQLQRTADCATHNLTRYVNMDRNSNANIDRKAKKLDSAETINV